jgi:sugar phosphate isomerase/epimerase
VAGRIVAGSLSPQNWHRQARSLSLEQRFEFSLGKTLEAQRRFGFRPFGIDFGLTGLPSRDPAYLDELAARLRENELLPNVGLGGLRLSNDADIRTESVDELKRNMELAARLGAKRGTFGGTFFGRVVREGRIRYCIDMVRQIGPRAAELGLRITQENYDYFTADDLVRICRAVAMPHVGVHSDTGNWLILGENPLEATRRVLPHTLHAHVRDYVLESDTYNGVALGDGLVDFPSILPVLAEAPVEEIVFSVEVDTDDRDEDDAADRSFAYLKDWLDRR